MYIIENEIHKCMPSIYHQYYTFAASQLMCPYVCLCTVLSPFYLNTAITFLLAILTSLSFPNSLELIIHIYCSENEWVQLQKPHIHASSCLSGLVVQFRGLHGQKRQALEARQSLVLSFEEKRKNLSRQPQWQWQQQQSPPQRWEQRIKTKAETKTETKSSVS